MEERINQALVQLESDLQNLSSARDQVEKTVDATTELQKTVGEYVASVKSLCSELNTGVDNLKERESMLGHDVESAIADIGISCSSIVTSFTSHVDEIKTSFEKGTKETLSKYIDENNKLSKYIEGLSELKEQIKNASNGIQLVKEFLAQVSTDLKDSQNAQDETLEALGKEQENLCAKSNEIMTSCDGISKSLDSVSSTIEGGSTVVNDLKNEISEIRRSGDTYRMKIGSDIGKLDEKVSALSNQLEATKRDLLKSSNANRWIVVVGIVVLAVLMFVCK